MCLKSENQAAEINASEGRPGSLMNKAKEGNAQKTFSIEMLIYFISPLVYTLKWSSFVVSYSFLRLHSQVTENLTLRAVLTIKPGENDELLDSSCNHFLSAIFLCETALQKLNDRHLWFHYTESRPPSVYSSVCMLFLLMAGETIINNAQRKLICFQSILINKMYKTIQALGFLPELDVREIPKAHEPSLTSVKLLVPISNLYLFFPFIQCDLISYRNHANNIMTL